jgi:hypothetical protein
MPTTRRVYVLGTELAGNREMVSVDEATAATYTLDEAAVVVYTDGTAAFPYTV